ARFKNEFRVLQDLRHPNLVALYDLIAEGGQWFFTMELIEGVDLYSWVRPGQTSTATSGSASTRRARTAPPSRDAAAAPTETQAAGAAPRHPAAIAARVPTGSLWRGVDPAKLRDALAQLA